METSCWRIRNRTSELSERVRFLIQILRVRKYRTKHFPCGIGGFQVTSSPLCWWTVNKRSLISSLCLSTSICSFHHCYLSLPRLQENLLLCLLYAYWDIHHFGGLFILNLSKMLKFAATTKDTTQAYVSFCLPLSAVKINYFNGQPF